MTQCDHCPLRDRAEECPAVAANHPRFCRWVDPDDPGYKPGGADVLLAMAAGVASRPAVAPPVAATIPVAESSRRLKLARACEHRTNPKCGCAGMATCLLGKGKDGQVSLSECVACVAGRDTE